MNFRVALTGDFLRVSPLDGRMVGSQTGNVAWMERIIGARGRWRDWGVSASTVLVPSEALAFAHALGDSAWLARYVEDAGQAWASLYDNEAPRAFRSTLEALSEHDLVVGFELAPTVKRALHHAGTPYLSLSIHPLRFLRDLCFLVTTNSESIACLVRECAVSQEEIEFQARRFSALFCRQRPVALRLPDDVPIIAGQTAKDSVLISAGRFADWPDYEGPLAQLLSQHAEVIFLEHPKRMNSTPVTEYLRCRLGKTVISVKANSYGVVFSDNQTPFYLTLASSLGSEARCAGHKCEFLLGEAAQRLQVSGVDLPSLPMVSHAILRDAFWRAVFSGQSKLPAQALGDACNAFFLGDNYLRDTLDAWAFEGLRAGVKLAAVRKVLMPAASAMPEKSTRLGHILGEWAAGARPRFLGGEIHAQTWGVVQVLHKPVSCGHTRALDFASPLVLHNLREGFHAPEHWGVWSNGRIARVMVPLDFGAADQLELRVDLVVIAYAGVLELDPVLRIHVEGREVAVIGFKGTDSGQVAIGFNCRVTQPDCRIDFHMSHSRASPVADGGQNVRELGFALAGLTFGVAAP